MIKLPKILPAPERPVHLPSDAKWLSGEGAGSWFVIEPERGLNEYTISRYSPEGSLECEGLFVAAREMISHLNYEITYPAHCSVVTVIQEEEVIRFEAKAH